VNDLRIAGGLVGITSLMLLSCGVAIGHSVPILLGAAGVLAAAVAIFHGRIPEQHRAKAVWAVGAVPGLLMVVFGLLTGTVVMLLLGVPIVIGAAIGLFAPPNAQVSGPPGWVIHVVAIGMLVVLTMLPSTELRVAAFLIVTTVGSAYFLRLTLRARRG
jgi:hypothetical protein